MWDRIGKPAVVAALVIMVALGITTAFGFTVAQGIAAQPPVSQSASVGAIAPRDRAVNNGRSG